MAAAVASVLGLEETYVLKHAIIINTVSFQNQSDNEAIFKQKQDQTWKIAS